METARPIPWLVTDWVPASRLTLLAGHGGTGKSRLALQLAAAVAAGEPHWIPPHIMGAGATLGPLLCKPSPAPAVLLSYEDHQADIAHGLTAIGLAADRLGDRLRYYDLSGAEPLWATDYGSTGGSTETLRAIFQQVADWQARLLVIDPSAAAYAGDENNRAAVRLFCGFLASWAYAHQCAVLLVQHPPKNGSDYSGSTDWLAASRSLITLSVDEEIGGTVMRLRKANYAHPGQQVMLCRRGRGGLWMATGHRAVCRTSHESGGVNQITRDDLVVQAEMGQAGLA